MVDSNQVCLVKLLVELLLFLVYQCGFQCTLLSLCHCVGDLWTVGRNRALATDTEACIMSVLSLSRCYVKIKARTIWKSYLKQWGKEAWEDASVLCQKWWHTSDVSTLNVSRKKSRNWIYLSQAIIQLLEFLTMRRILFGPYFEMLIVDPLNSWGKTTACSMSEDKLSLSDGNQGLVGEADEYLFMCSTRFVSCPIFNLIEEKLFARMLTSCLDTCLDVTFAFKIESY